jgi:hypothetical protein
MPRVLFLGSRVDGCVRRFILFYNLDRSVALTSEQPRRTPAPRANTCRANNQCLLGNSSNCDWQTMDESRREERRRGGGEPESECNGRGVVVMAAHYNAQMRAHTDARTHTLLG